MPWRQLAYPPFGPARTGDEAVEMWPRGHPEWLPWFSIDGADPSGAERRTRVAAVPETGTR
jgi:hypothetical protein